MHRRKAMRAHGNHQQQGPTKRGKRTHPQAHIVTRAYGWSTTQAENNIKNQDEKQTGPKINTIDGEKNAR